MNAGLTYVPDFLGGVANKTFTALWHELNWERRGSTPRFEYFASKLGKPYAYGVGEHQREYQPQEWHPAMCFVDIRLQTQTGIDFDVCFLNGYADQRDHLGWHADNSPEMDDDRPIAIVSLGVEREIWFRPNTDHSAVEKMTLGHGSLLLMPPGFQDTHQHRIPKASFACGQRVSLTFRGYVEP